MHYSDILVLATALSMDAFAVALAMGIRLCIVSRGQTCRLAFSFGFFQFFMPILGWYLGSTVSQYIEEWDHWLAFGLLSFVGVKMIHEALTAEKEDDNAVCIDPTRGTSLLMLSMATSVDALAVGLSLAFLGHPVWEPAVGIGIVCALFTTIGLRLGSIASKATSHLGSRAAIVGGIVLIAIGVKMLQEHGVFSG